jgi:hypothetical protein
MRVGIELVSCLFLGVGALGAAQNNVPWPAIPKPQGVASTNSPVNVYPTSVRKGLSSDFANNSAESALVFQSIGDTYTRKY